MDEQLLAKVHRRMAEAEDECAPTDIARIVREEAGVISDVDVFSILRRMRQDTRGIGRLEPLVQSPAVTDIVVNGPEEIWVDKGDGLTRVELAFDSENEVRQLATRLVVACGGRLDDAQPYADGRISRADGTHLRIHAVLSPPAAQGTCLSIRVLRPRTLSLKELVSRRFLSSDLADVLIHLMAARRSFLVVGGTGSGKTTLLSALLRLVPSTERVLCIEDTLELQPPHPHVVNLTTRGANADHRGEITLRDLVRQALRMRPDRLVVGEIRGPEIVELLAALNTGHEGGAGTLHANSVEDVPARVEALAALGGLDRHAAHTQFAAAIEAIIGVRRRADGHREIHSIGLVSRDGTCVEPVWTNEEGSLPGFSEFRARLSQGPGGASCL